MCALSYFLFFLLFVSLLFFFSICGSFRYRNAKRRSKIFFSFFFSFDCWYLRLTQWVSLCAQQKRCKKWPKKNFHFHFLASIFIYQKSISYWQGCWKKDFKKQQRATDKKKNVGKQSVFCLFLFFLATNVSCWFGDEQKK